MSPAARMVLQNDVWGLWQRFRDVSVSSDARASIMAACARVVRHLALAPGVIAGLRDPSFARLFPAHAGWRERGIGVPDLVHERLFGYRREFRVYTREGAAHDRALVNRILAIDTSGEVHPTELVGGVERIVPSAAPVRVEVFDRDRGAPGAMPLVAETLVRALPAHGANGALVRFDAPTEVRAEVCMRCHHTLDDDANFTESTPTVDPLRGARMRARAALDARAMLPPH